MKIGHWALGIGHWALGIDYFSLISPISPICEAYKEIKDLLIY
ncbi:hypothetical protein [Nostoc sp.]